MLETTTKSSTNTELQATLERLEQGFWEATRDAAYYKANMADEGLAVFAEMIMTKPQAIESTSGSGISNWTDISIEDVTLKELAPEVSALVYRGSAKRDGASYSANVTTVYVLRDGRWQMMLHQQSATESARMLAASD